MRNKFSNLDVSEENCVEIEVLTHLLKATITKDCVHTSATSRKASNSRYQ